VAAIVLATINAKWIHPSLALRLLTANLGEMTSQCAIVELALRQPLAEKIAAILAQPPRILGISVSIWNHGATVELLAELERFWRRGSAQADTTGAAVNARPAGPPYTKPVIVLGGPELTYLPKTAGIFRYADFVIRGEGETAFAELCRSILLNGGGPNTANGTFIDAAPVDLAAIKPGYSLYTAEDLRRKLIYVEASRGCPFACAFCQSAAEPVESGRESSGAGVREFPLKTFLADLETLLRRSAKNVGTENVGAENGGIKNGGYGGGSNGGRPRTVKFLDRSFNSNIPRALRILEYCLSKTRTADGTGIYPQGLQFHFEMVPAIFPEELRKTLARFPPESLRLEIGIQSFNPETSALINRVSNPRRELETLHFLRTQTHAVVHADLIAGLPGEDRSSFGKGFDRLWIALSGGALNAGSTAEAPFEIQLGILKCLPGTPLRTMAESGNFKAEYDNSAPYEVTATGFLPKADMDAVKNFARFWERIVNRRPFPELLPVAAPPGEPVFERFMELSRRLFNHFGRNWAIPKSELREAVEKSLLF
jgi:radical SAM superfamily enzyme YgiQ (UPF0313 family)